MTFRTGSFRLDRMSEDMPLGSRGGTSVRHRFPVDGEYEISVGLQRGRFDAVLGSRAGTQARSAGSTAEARTVHDRRPITRGGKCVHGTGQDPDAHLKVRVPVKAGTRTLVATFLKDTVVPEGIPARRARRAFLRRRRQHFGRRPVRCARTGRHSEPRQDFRLPSRRRPPRSRLAPKRSSPISRTAPIGGRLPPTICRHSLALYRKAPRADGFEAGVQIGAAEDSGVARIHFPHGVRSAGCGARERLPDQRCRARIAPVLLPVEQHSRRRTARGRRARRAR